MDLLQYSIRNFPETIVFTASPAYAMHAQFVERINIRNSQKFIRSSHSWNVVAGGGGECCRCFPVDQLTDVLCTHNSRKVIN